MFCPACGTDNYEGRKFCASCGTNLDVVSRALYSNSTGIFTRAENALDQVIARYAERVFRDAPTHVPSRRLSDSWRVLAQGLATLTVDFVLFWLMIWIVLPLRLLTLLLTSPIKLLIQRSGRSRGALETGENKPAREAPALPPVEWTASSPVSAVEHTTEHLIEHESRKRRLRGDD